MSYPVVVAYGRTPCCRARKGGLADVNPIDYAAACLKGVIAKVPYIEQHPEEIGDVVTGCAMAINELNLNASRLIVNRPAARRCPRSDHQPFLLLRPAGHLHCGQRHFCRPV